jgi:hypothetical protein
MLKGHAVCWLQGFVAEASERFFVSEIIRRHVFLQVSLLGGWIAHAVVGGGRMPLCYLGTAEPLGG